MKNKEEGGQTTNICQEARLDIKDSSTACSRQSNIATVQHRKNKRKAEENPVRKAKKRRITNNRRHSFNDDNISFVNAKKEDSHDVSGTRGSVNFLQTDEGQQPVVRIRFSVKFRIQGSVLRTKGDFEISIEGMF